MASSKRAGQIAMPFMRRKRRKKPGPKPSPDAGVPHARRPELSHRHPVHVTWRVAEEVWNLRTRNTFRVALRAFQAARERLGIRLTHYSVQANHVHLVIEADDARALSRGLQGLGIRLAKGLNRVMGRKGRVFEDRYHEHLLRSPKETFAAIRYVLGNTWVHAARLGIALVEPMDLCAAGPDHDGGWRWLDPWGPPPVSEPRTWLLREGWRRALA